MRLFEVSPHNFDSDWDYQDALNRPSRPKRHPRPDAIHPDDAGEDRMMKNIQKAQMKPKFKGMEGDYDGKPFNAVIVYDGPRQKVEHNIRMDMEHSLRNIFHDVAGVKVKDRDDGVRGVIYVLVRKGSIHAPLVKAVEDAGIELAE